MIVTATEFKTNFGKYLDMLRSEDIFITRNGKTVAKINCFFKQTKPRMYTRKKYGNTVTIQ